MLKKEIRTLFDGRNSDRLEIIDNILKNRGVENEIEFLNPSENDLIPFENMKNLEKGFNIIWNCIEHNGKFVIHADVDVDGVTSASIMYRYLKLYTNKDNIKTTINSGKIHGVECYDLDTLKDVDIMIIVDSINNVEDYKRILDTGVKIVVLDHHIISNDLLDFEKDNKNIALISSANDYKNPHLSGAGVVWKFCKYIDDITLNDYADSLSDLAMTGIIADMCDITVPENRYICYKGLSNITNPVIKAMANGYKINGQTISFTIAPLINSAMRMNRNDIVKDIFMCDDKKSIALLISELKELKEKQKQEVQDTIENLDTNTVEYDTCIIGVVNTEHNTRGLIANKLMAEYQKPTVILGQHIIADEDSGEVKEIYYSGSARGIGVDDFRQIVNDTNLVDFAEGHELAFGVKINADNYIPFIRKIQENLKDIEFKNEIIADAEINTHQITRDLIADTERLCFLTGEGFKPIKFKINIEDYDISLLKDKHIKITCNDITFLKWNDNDVEKYADKKLTVIGSLSMSWFRGKPQKQVIVDEFIIREG